MDFYKNFRKDDLKQYLRSLVDLGVPLTILALFALALAMIVPELQIANRP